MIFYVVLLDLIFQFYKALDQIKIINQELYYQFLIHFFDLDKYLKLIIKKQKEYFLII